MKPTPASVSAARANPSLTKPSMLLLRRPYHCLLLPFFRPRSRPRPRRRRRLCSSASTVPYRDAFGRRMAMAGVKPHHRIAVGVSGGPDSMALCALTARWKTEGTGGAEGVLGVIVDHKLRSGSSEEAEMVRDRVLRMGVKCEIRCCEWPDGRPKQGHIQEAARDMRYQIFHEVCMEHQIAVLLIAQHEDDQIELFILRLSRNSGVLGLAGMAFASQLFPTHLEYRGENIGNQGILLVRPMLDFSKDDMYKICQEEGQEWVEDPTNQSLLFARNRIRSSLSNSSSGAFRLEMKKLISACRSTRSYIESLCHKMIEDSVIIMDHGYAIIDLQKLEPSNVESICLSKFIAFILQFISQRHRPIRGRVSQLLINYMRNIPCKTSFTGAGCYLCPAPQSKGTKVLVCCSPESLQPSKTWLSRKSCEGQQPSPGMELDQIIMEAKSHSDQLVPKSSHVPFLHVNSSEVLTEAKKLNLIGESTISSIHILQQEESKKFRTRTETDPDNDSAHEIKLASASRISLRPWESCHFMNRFLVTWKLHNDVSDSKLDITGVNQNPGANGRSLCPLCMINSEETFSVRRCVDADWVYLSQLSEGKVLEDCDHHHDSLPNKLYCSRYMQMSARRALKALKSIPVAVRRGLPVLVNNQDLLLSIPSICFRACPHLSVDAVFMPGVPLGGGYSSFI